MGYTLVVKRRAQKELDILPKEIRTRILKQLYSLAEDPRPLGVCKMAGRIGYWRIRIGNYRVVYEIKDDVLVVTVVKVAHRRYVYTKL